jgi:hypothetical protein
LRNLLSNAAKYSPEGTPIELRVIGKEGRVRLEVADHGPGIHPDDVTRIFEKFGRGRGAKDARGRPRSLPQPAHRAGPWFRAGGKGETRRGRRVRVRAGGSVMEKRSG